MQKLHPDGVAALIAVIVAPEDVRRLKMPHSDALSRAIDRRRDEVLRLAAQYYRIHPCDFDNSRDFPQQRNGSQNLAKLDRRNLR